MGMERRFVLWRHQNGQWIMYSRLVEEKGKCRGAKVMVMPGTSFA